MREFSFQVKRDSFKSPGSFVEVVRLLDGFLFDEVAIKKIETDYMGRHAHIEYERHGKRLTDLMPLVIGAEEFAQLRQNCRKADGTVDLEMFAKSALVARLFAEGSRQWLERNKKAEENFIEDIGFLEDVQKAVTPQQ